MLVSNIALRKLALFIPALYLTLLPSSLAAISDSTCLEADIIISTAQEFHYAPRPSDSAFSQLVFDGFIDRLNPSGSFLTASDVDALASYRFTAGNGSEVGCALVSDGLAVYSQRLDALKDLLSKQVEAEINFDSNDRYVFADDVATNEEEWESTWKSYFKYRVLNAVYSAQDSAQRGTMPSPELIAEWKERIGEQILCRIDNQVKAFGRIESYISEQYLESLASAYDPHTQYFSAKALESFEEALSKTALSYGVEFYRNQTGDVEIVSVLPGSYAWRSNRVNEGDVLVSVTVNGKNIDNLGCSSVNEIMSIFETSNSGAVLVRLRKRSGDEIEIELREEEIEVQSNVIQSFILSGERRICYIYLPSFYTSMEEFDGLQGCAIDVSMAIIRLKRAGVDGLIIDLRDNGGGSMYEAVRMAGIFVDYGALSIYAERNSEVEIINDMDRGSMFDAPMAVLVNSFSASASELFSAAMQDRNRAVIVGQATYGKSTAQNVVPLIASDRTTSNPLPGSYLKLTTGGFYRVTGESHQSLGIIPDIPLEINADYSEYLEASSPSALQLPPLKTNAHYFPDEPLPIQELNARSIARETRTSDSSAISMVRSLSSKIREQGLSLNYYDYSALMAQSESLDDVAQQVLSEHPAPFTIEPVQRTFGRARRESNQVQEQVLADTEIIECYSIVNDLIQILSH